MSHGVEQAPKTVRASSRQGPKKKKKDVAGSALPSTAYAASPPKPPEDHRVPGVKADPMAANGHHAEENAQAAATIEKKASGMPPAMKEAMDNMRAAAETAVLVSTMGQVNDRNGRWKFLNTLDRIDDPAVRKRVKEQFEEQTKQSLDHFIETAPWHSKRDREQAQDMVSSKRDHTEDALSGLAKSNPAEYEKKKVQAIQWASAVLATTRKDDVDHDSDAKQIFDTLGPRTPEEIELIRAEIRKQTGGRTAYQEIDKSLSGGTEDEALAGLKGDKINAIAAGIRNADGNVKRMEELLHRLNPDEIKKLNAHAPDVAVIAIQSVPAGQREQIGDLVTGNRAHADATHIADLFKDPKDGFEMDGPMPSKQSLANVENRKTDNIIKELRGMSPQAIRAAREAWNADPDNKDNSWSEMIERRFKDGDSTTLMRIRALSEGNKVEERAFALRDGMRKQNQDEIEGALANPDLTSDDPMKKSVAIAEKFELEQRVLALDAAAARASAAMTGKDPNAVIGRQLEDQLSDYYKEYGEKIPHPKDFDSAMELMKGEEKLKQKRTAQAAENKVVSTEVLDQGEVSTVTQIARAEKKGDLETKAQLLENVKSTSEKEALEKNYSNRYAGKSIYADPRAKEFTALAEYKQKFMGDDRPLSEIQTQIADESRNSNEHRIHNVQEYGAKVERTPYTEYRLQQEQLERQHSGSLENSELMREYMGGNAGTEDLAKHQLQNMKESFVEQTNPFDMTQPQLKDGVSQAEFNARDKAMTTTLEVQRSEKIKHAERLAMAFSTIAKIAALLAGQPHLVFLIDAAAGLTEMAIKSSAMGNDYDASTDAKMFGLTMAVDALTLGAGKYFSGAASKIDDVVAAEQTGAKVGGELVEKAATSEAKKEFAEDAIKQVAKGEPSLASGIAKAGDETVEGGMAMAKTEQALAKAETEVAETAVETGADAARKTLQRQEMVANLGIGGFNTVGAGMIQGDNADDMFFGVMRGMFGTLIPASMGGKIDKLLGTGKLGSVVKAGLNIATDMTVGGNDLKFALAGAAGNHMQAKKAQKGGGGDDHVMSHLAEEPTYRPTVDDDAAVATRTPVVEENPYLVAHGHNAEADHLVTQTGATEMGSPANQPKDLPPSERITQQMEAVVPPSERITQQMEAVVPPSERITQQMAAVDANGGHTGQPTVATSEPANSPAKEAQQAFVDAAPSLQERIDRATGVDRGDVEQRRKDWEAMYAQQEVEAQNVVHVENRIVEPKIDGNHYEANQNYDVRRFAYDNGVLTSITIDSHIAAAPGVTRQDVANAKASTFKGVDSIVNTNEEGKRNTLPDGSKLHVEPVFHDDASKANNFIELQQPQTDPTTGVPIEGTSNQFEWKTNDVQNPATAAHEGVGHPLGFPDTYVDPNTHGRATPTSPGVTNNGSFMQTIRPEDRPRMTQDHLDQLGRDIARAESGVPQGGLQQVPHSPPLGYTPAPQPPTAARQPPTVAAARPGGWHDVAPEHRTEAKTGDQRRVVKAPQGEMVISGSTTGPNGEPYYILEHPVTGAQEKVPARWLDGDEPTRPIDEPHVVDDDLDLATEEQLSDDSDRTRERSREELDADAAPDIINQERDQRTTPRETEDDTNTRPLNGQVPEEQVSFLNGERVPYGTRGSVRPDGWVVGASAEAKNYSNLHTDEQQQKLVENISGQARRRDIHLPPGTEQHVTIDVRGQNISEDVMMQLRFDISGETNGSISPDRITFLTDDGDNTLEAVNDPMDRQGNFRDGDRIGREN